MRRGAWLAVIAALLAACGEETPTGVGGPLLPGGAIRTFEVILDAADYLESDTAFSGYTSIRDGDFELVAHRFEDVLEANVVARFDIPTVIGVIDSTGVARSDSTPVFVGGRIVARIDTLRSNLPKPARFRASRIAEVWDPATTSWQWRVDSAGARAAWTRPGGAGGAEIEALDWTAGGADSLVIPVDSATIAAWADTTTRARGAALSLLTPGSRARLADFVLRLNARSRFKRDTLFTTTIRPPDATFVYDPPLGGTAATPAVSGSPGWRTFFKFRPALGARTVACPYTAGCRVRLDDTAITYAALQLVPDGAPRGYVPQDSVRLEARTVYASDRAPLARSPLGVSVGVMADAIRPDAFRAPDGVAIEVPLTAFVSGLASADSTLAPPSPYVALLPVLEGVDFGVATFRAAPRLRLVLTVATELQLR
jgi:hypothetical protein